MWLILLAYLVLAQFALYWAWHLAKQKKGEGEGDGEGALAAPLLISKGEEDEEAGGVVGGEE